MSSRIELLKHFISFPIREFYPDWFYVERPAYPMWLHICKPHYWKMIAEAVVKHEIATKLAFSYISSEECHRCRTSVPEDILPLGKLLSLGQEIT